MWQSILYTASLTTAANTSSEISSRGLLAATRLRDASEKRGFPWVVGVNVVSPNPTEGRIPALEKQGGRGTGAFQSSNIPCRSGGGPRRDGDGPGRRGGSC